MSFPLVTTAEKLRVLNHAKAEFQTEIYKNISKLGLDAESYDVSTWDFDPEATPDEVDPDFHIKRAVTVSLERIVLIDSKIANLS
jgi:hypothetical protein